MKMIIFRVYFPSICENIQKKKDFISVDVLLQNRKKKKKKKSMSFLMLEVFKVYTKGNVRDRIYSL
jgi:hypothetical protein